MLNNLKRLPIAALLAQGGSATSALVFAYLIAKSLLPVPAGLFFIAAMVANVVSILARVGMDAVIIRILSAQPRYSRSVYQQGLLITLAGNLLGGALVFAFAEKLSIGVFDKQDLGLVLRLIAPSIVGLAIINFVTFVLMGIGRANAAIFFQNGVINVLMSIYLLVANPSLAGDVAIVYSLTTIVVACALLFWSWRLVTGKGADAHNWRTIVKSGLLLSSTNVVQMTVRYLAQFVAAVVLAADQVSILVLAEKLVRPVTYIRTVLFATLGGRIASSYAAAGTAEFDLVRKEWRWALVWLLAAVLIVFMCASFSVEFLLGDHYRLVAAIAWVFMLGQIIMSTATFAETAMAMVGFEDNLLKANLLAAISGVLVIGVVAVVMPSLFAIAWSVAALSLIKAVVSFRYYRRSITR